MMIIYELFDVFLVILAIKLPIDYLLRKIVKSL